MTKTLSLKVISPSELKNDSLETEGWSPGQFSQYLRDGAVQSLLPLEAYAGFVEVLSRCVELRSSAVAGLPRQIESLETGEILATANWPHPLLDDNDKPLTERRLFEQLRLNLNLGDLLWRTEIAQCLLGQSYWLTLKRGRKVLGARWLDPARVKPEYNKTGIAYWDYTHVVGNQSVSTSPLSVEDVVYVWRPSLREWASGSPPAQAAASAAGIVYNASLFMNVFFANGAMPVTIVMSEDNPPEHERDRLKLFLGSMMRGVRNAFNLEVVSSILKFEKLTPDIKDLDFTAMTEKKEKSIAVAMGIPLSVLFSGVGNYAGSSEKDDLHFYDKTILPEMQLLGERLNEQFFNPLGLNLAWRFDLLEVYAQRELAKLENALQMFDRQLMTPNELRQAGGLPPLTDEELAALGHGREPAPAIPDAPPAMLTADATPAAEQGMEAEEGEELRQEDIKRWERKVLRAMKRGTAPKDVPFESEHIPIWEADAIQQALGGASTAEEVKAILAIPFVGRRDGGQGLAPVAVKGLHREDDRRLASIERTAVAEVHGGLQAQLAAIREQADSISGDNVDVLVVRMVEAAASQDEPLQKATQRMVYASASQGATAVAKELPQTLGMLVDWDMMSQEAFTFSQTYAFDLVTDLNKTTERGLRYALERWIEEGGTLDELADSIRPIFANEPATARIEGLFGIDRARLIATTEATRAYAQGKVDAWTASGEAENPPDAVPPAHPGCRCDISMERQADGSWLWRWDTARDERVCPLCAPYITSPYIGEARPSPRQPEPTPEPQVNQAEQARMRLLEEDGRLSASIEKAEEGIKDSQKNLNALFDEYAANPFPDFQQRLNLRMSDLEEKRRLLSDLEENRGQILRSLLHVQDPASIGVTFAKGVPKYLKEVATSGASEFNKFVSRSVINDTAVIVKKTAQSRAFFTAGEQTIALSTKGGGSGIKTFLHEAGHWVEDISPSVREKVHAFYEMRTEGYRLEHMGKGYPRSEKTRIDNFINPYMGKDYSDRKGRYATEILSMGLEMFYTDPKRLATEDPEYFDFIFDLLRGN